MDILSYPFSKTYSGLTSFFSLEYLVLFLPFALFVYFITPSKVKKYLLLILSYLFFGLISGKLVAYLLLTTISAFFFGKFLNKIHTQRDVAIKQVEKDQRKEIKNQFQKKLKIVLSVSVVVHIGLLLVLKYTDFFMSNVNSFIKMLGFDFAFVIPNLLIPIGISFFTLQTVSYLVDVYRKTISAENNFFKLALFISFFPQIVEGPICRYSQTSDQLWSVKQINFDNFTMGAQRFLFGMMKKIVIADRLNPLVSSVFERPSEYGGIMVIVGAVAYTIQLYMDFSGTMDAVIGIAQIFGIEMPENFKRPFFSKSISEFWTRWHITLGTWFKDYIFYPVSMSKKMKNLTTNARKKIGNYYGPLVAGSVALFCVWFSNGLWHGSAWSYIFFGMYHFSLILMGNLTAPLSKKLLTKLKINSDSTFYSVFKMVRTSVLVVVGELFFRADGFRKGLRMFMSIFTDFRLPSLEDGFLGNFRLSLMDLLILIIAVLIIFVISILNEKNIILRQKLKDKNAVLRWGLIYASIIMIVVFGAYGDGYVQLDPIYANF